ncbi:uncharacterized protein [Fopius arisanus]|uniref:Uncharacterized protein n=1 Tax=Fopius arisanus TaxID=64838 RepID=A0A9R1TWC9_9HYME|nr:PREDICTED: uncharacterized protein LOC105263943 [Fopius arisanus]
MKVSLGNLGKKNPDVEAGEDKSVKILVSAESKSSRCFKIIKLIFYLEIILFLGLFGFITIQWWLVGPKIFELSSTRDGIAGFRWTPSSGSGSDDPRTSGLSGYQRVIDPEDEFVVSQAKTFVDDDVSHETYKAEEIVPDDSKDSGIQTGLGLLKEDPSREDTPVTQSAASESAGMSVGDLEDSYKKEEQLSRVWEDADVFRSSSSETPEDDERTVSTQGSVESVDEPGNDSIVEPPSSTPEEIEGLINPSTTPNPEEMIVDYFEYDDPTSYEKSFGESELSGFSTGASPKDSEYTSDWPDVYDERYSPEEKCGEGQISISSLGNLRLLLPEDRLGCIDGRTVYEIIFKYKNARSSIRASVSTHAGESQ